MLTAGALGAAKGFRLMRLASVGSMLGGELVCMGFCQASRNKKDVDETRDGLVVVVYSSSMSSLHLHSLYQRLVCAGRRWITLQPNIFLELLRRRVGLLVSKRPGLSRTACCCIESYLHFSQYPST